MHPGLFWPRRSTMRYPGHYKVRILPPIEPGMDPDAFFAHLIEVTERASDELLIDAATRNPDLPLPPTAVQRLSELRKDKTASA
jgi:1-acyl-sn-glycerol-3-phosphate acyltransferase